MPSRTSACVKVNALRDAERGGIAAADCKGLGADIGADARRQRQFGEQRQQQAAGARADVEDADRPLAPTFACREAERRLDERFGIGARVERRGESAKRRP